MAALQIVVRNSRAEVVNVMEADITREPLEQLGQLVLREAIAGPPPEFVQLQGLVVHSLKGHGHGLTPRVVGHAG